MMNMNKGDETKGIKNVNNNKKTTERKGKINGKKCNN